MGWKSFKTEWLARRAGQKSLETSALSKSAREVVGPTGWMWSRGWDVMAEHQEAYAKSFDRRLPPSTFVSERERSRHNIPIPLVERLIGEDRDDDPPSQS